MGVLFLHGVPTTGQVSDGNDVVIGQSGRANFPIYLSTTLDGVAGVQGLFLYDPSRVGELTLAVSPLQAGSFMLRSHEPELGEVHFVTYSVDDTINSTEPFLVCEVESKEAGYASDLSSVVVVDLTYVSTPDGQPHAPSERYLNVPIRVEPEPPAAASWILY